MEFSVSGEQNQEIAFHVVTVHLADVPPHLVGPTFRFSLASATYGLPPKA
jgi:hypothetical protein